MSTLKSAMESVKGLSDEDFITFKQWYKGFIERKNVQLLDNFVVGSKIKFVGKHRQEIVAQVTKVSFKNLMATEVTVDGQRPSMPRRWTVSPQCCQAA